MALMDTGWLESAVRVTSRADVAGSPFGRWAATSANAWHETRLTSTSVAPTTEMTRPVVESGKTERSAGTSRWMKVSDSISSCTRAVAVEEEGAAREREQKKAPIGTASASFDSVPPLDAALKRAGVAAVKDPPKRTVPALSLKAWQVTVGSSMVAATPADAARLLAVGKTWSSGTVRPAAESPSPVFTTTWTFSLEAGTGTASPSAAKSEADAMRMEVVFIFEKEKRLNVKIKLGKFSGVEGNKQRKRTNEM